MFSKLSKMVMTLGVSLALLVPAVGFARTDQEIEEAINSVLSERHPSDTPEWWRSLGPTAPRVIMRMAEQSNAVYQRLRLVEALAWFSDDPQAVDFIKNQADQTSESVIRNAAIRSVGISQGAKEVDFVSKFLKNPDPQTRFAAAQTLKKMGDSHANSVLDKYLAEEKVSWIAPRLKGEMPKPTRLLNPVSSSEDRVNPAFEGDWKGFLIYPKSGTSGLEAEKVSLKLTVENPSVVKAVITRETKAKQPGQGHAPQVITIPKIEGKRNWLHGSLPADFIRQPLLKSGAKAEQLAFEAELRDEAGTRLIELRASKAGAYLLLRK